MALRRLADLWTAGIDAIEYADFLHTLFHQIAEGTPPDLFFWRPTHAIVHGGYTSPCKMRPQDVMASPRRVTTVDVLTLDDGDRAVVSHYAAIAARGGGGSSPLRGGRCCIDECPSDEAAIRRLTMSTLELGVAPPHTAPSEGPTTSTSRGRDVLGAPPPTAPVSGEASAHGRGDARWHDRKWHRPAGARASCNRNGRPHSSGMAPPTAGMSAAGLLGGVVPRSVADTFREALQRPSVDSRSLPASSSTIEYVSRLPTPQRRLEGPTSVATKHLQLAVDCGRPALMARPPLAGLAPNRIVTAARRAQIVNDLGKAVRAPKAAEMGAAVVSRVALSRERLKLANGSTSPHQLQSPMSWHALPRIDLAPHRRHRRSQAC